MKEDGALCVISRPALAESTSIRIGGAAIAELRAGDKKGLERAAALVPGFGGRPEMLGRGSNILAADGDLPLTLISLASRAEPVLVAEEEGAALLRVHGGLGLPALLAKAAALGLTGLEALAGIPGSVGGAVAMNAGSFGLEIGSLIREAEIFSPATGFVTLKARDMKFAYRRTTFPGLPEDRGGWLAVCSITLALARGESGAIGAALRETLRKKRQAQPIEAWSAGCAFKNPAPDAPAGLLLERAGFKGRRIGGVAFSEKHANFLVNLGGGSFAQAMELLDLARDKVKEMSGHELELEVRLWP